MTTTLSPFQFGINRVICEESEGESTCRIGTMANSTCNKFLAVDCQGTLTYVLDCSYVTVLSTSTDGSSIIHDVISSAVSATAYPAQPVSSSMIQHPTQATPTQLPTVNGSPTAAVPAPTETAVPSSSPLAHTVSHSDTGVVGGTTSVTVVLVIVATVSIVTCILHKIIVKRRHRHEAVCSLPPMDTPDV